MKKKYLIFFLILVTIGIFSCKKEEIPIVQVRIGIPEENNFVFYDFDPNVIVSYTTPYHDFAVDINRDSIDDLLFSSYFEGGNFYGFSGAHVYALHDDIGFLRNSSGISILEYNDKVNCNNNFSGESSTLTYFYYESKPYQIDDSTWAFQDTSYSLGNWDNVNDKYMAVKLLDDDKWCIGWIYLSVDYNGMIELYKYGCRTNIECP